jgi:hypothetical protein
LGEKQPKSSRFSNMADSDSDSTTMGSPLSPVHGHSPVHHGHDTLDVVKLFDTLSRMEGRMSSGFSSVSDKLDSMKEELTVVKQDVEHVKASVGILEENIKHVENTVVPKLEKELRSKIHELEQAKLESELYSRKSNLLFFNVPATALETNLNTESVLRDYLNNTMKIPNVDAILFNNVHRLPSKNKTKPVIAKFVRMVDRDRILNYVSPDRTKFGIAPHLPAVMQAERRRLIPIRDKLSLEGNTAKIYTKGTQVQLYVNKTLWKE